MAENLPLFIEDCYEALRAAVNALGGPKVIGQALWPKLSVVRARQDLLDCLNPENARKLDFEEVMMILRMAKAKGFHQTKHWIDAELGYEPSEPADPLIERDRLADELARAAEKFESLTLEVKRLGNLQEGVPVSLLKRAG